MQVGAIVTYKNAKKIEMNDLFQYEILGYVYYVKDDEVKVCWNIGLCEWEDINNLDEVDLTNKKEIYSVARMFYNKENHNYWDFNSYLDWINTRYGSVDDEEYLQLENSKYPKVDFIEYKDGQIRSLRDYMVKLRRITPIDKYTLYEYDLQECYYNPKKYYYIVNTEDSNVYAVKYNNQSKIFNLQLFKTELKEVVTVSNLSEKEKEKLEKESRKVIKKFTGKDIEEFNETSIPSEKQIYYIQDLLNNLYIVIKNDNSKKFENRLANFKFNNYFNLYELKTRKRFKDINNNKEIDLIINALKMFQVYIQVSDEKGLKSQNSPLKIVEKYFIFKELI